MADKNKIVGDSATVISSDNTILSNGHTWSIKKDTGTFVINAEKGPSLTLNFPTISDVGLYTVRHEGTNTCGDCTPYVEHTIQVTETSTPGSSKTIYYAMGAAVLGFLILSKKK